MKVNGADANETLLTKFIQSKGNSIITFDASNIKQFWIDNSIVSKKESFEILLNNISHKSVPYKIQLANVDEAQDCKVDIITDSADLFFTILDNRGKIIAESKEKESFLQYTITSASFHLFDAIDYSFSMQFDSKNSDVISCKSVIISFSQNSYFKTSPGVLKLNAESFSNSSPNATNSNIFEVSGKRTQLLSKYRIQVADNTLKYSITLKNTGKISSELYIGYALYAKGGRRITNKQIPYTNDIYEIISIDRKSNRLIINQCTNWKKGCFVALNAKEDLSDFPNFNLLDGRISEVKQLDENKSEMILDKPFDSSIKPGMKIRIQSQEGGTYIYTTRYNLKPGEEKSFTNEIKKDDEYFKYSAKSFCKSTYYAMPILLSYSDDPNVENTIQISDYTISY